MVKTVVEYKSGASAPVSATALCDLLRAALTKQINIGRAKVSVSGTATVIVSGAAGFPMFIMSAPQNGTSAETLATIALHATAATAIAQSSGVVTVTTAAAHGLATGKLVDLTVATGFTFTRNDGASVASIKDARIHVMSATTFVLSGVVGSGTNTGAAVLTIKPSQETGSAAVVAVTVAEQGALVAPVAGQQYTQYSFEYANPVSSLNSITRYQGGSHILFVNCEAESATPTIFNAFDKALTEVMSGLAVGTTDANPELLGVEKSSN
jgi:hypothetical protein